MSDRDKVPVVPARPWAPQVARHVRLHRPGWFGASMEELVRKAGEYDGA